MRRQIVTSAVWGLWFLSTGAAFAADERAVRIPEALSGPVERLQAALSKWPVRSIDQEPAVPVDGRMGYRMVLRSTRKVPGPNTQLPQLADSRPDYSTYVTVHEDWHFVLVPAGETPLAENARRDILWHVADEKKFRLPIALGEGLGFSWFTFTSIPEQHHLRDILKLTGGDDRLQLAVRGLSVEDEGTMTRNSVIWLFPTFGDEGFAALDPVISRGNEPARSAAIRSLQGFQDERTTARLIELYHSSEPEVHKMAAYVLVHKPYRPAAKAAYFDMLRTRARVTEAMRICAAQNWNDALPLIEDVVEKPPTLIAYRDAYVIYREMSGRPIAADVLAAEHVIHPTGRGQAFTAEDRAAAHRSIIESADVDGAAFVGLRLAVFTTKGDSRPVNEAGIEILRALPRPTVEKLIRRLLAGLEGSDVERVRKLAEQVL